MTKINITNSIIFVTDSIATSYIDDMEDDVAIDLAKTWIAMIICKLTWPMTWLLTCRVTSAPRPICGWAQFSMVHKLGPNISQPTINFQLTKFSTIYTAQIKIQHTNHPNFSTHLSKQKFQHKNNSITWITFSFSMALNQQITYTCFHLASLVVHCSIRNKKKW